MKYILSIVLMALVMALGFSSASADELRYELGYTTVSADDSGASIDLGALYGTVSYAINERGRYINELEGSIWFGVADDSFGSAEFNLEPSLEAGYRGRYALSGPGQSVFWRAVYTRITIEADSVIGAGTFTDSESGFGLGVGAEMRGFTVGYTQYFGELENFSRLNIGYRF